MTEKFPNNGEQNPLVGIVLAAGKGTRMKSDLPKVLHLLLGKPMIHHVLDTLISLKLKEIIVIVGHRAPEVQQALNSYPVKFAMQANQRGTGHAVKQAKSLLSAFDGDVLIMCGDTPLFTSDTLSKFLAEHRRAKSKLSILSSSKVKDPHGYGRIVKKSPDDSKVIKIVEEKDATDKEKAIKEINTGIYLVSAPLLFSLVDKIECNNQQGEFYLTDIVSLAVKEKISVYAFSLASEEEALGVNSQDDLKQAEKIMRQRMNQNCKEKD